MKTVTDCPVAALGVKLAAATKAYDGAERQTYEVVPLDPFERASQTREGERRLSEIGDLVDSLLDQAQWLTPNSARGALLTAALLNTAMRDAVEEIAGGGSLQEKDLRRARRFLRALFEFLERESGGDLKRFGLGGYGLGVHEVPGDKECESLIDRRRKTTGQGERTIRRTRRSSSP